MCIFKLLKLFGETKRDSNVNNFGVKWWYLLVTYPSLLGSALNGYTITKLDDGQQAGVTQT